MYRDKLKAEIDGMARALGKLLAMMLGTDVEEETDVETLTSTINKTLNIDIEEFLVLPPGDIKSYLKARNFQPVHLEKFGEILIARGRRVENQDRRKTLLHYSRALDLYFLADEVYGTISLERYQQEEWLREQLASG